MLSSVLIYFEKSSAITIIVLALLLVYFIVSNWIFFYKIFYLKVLQKREDFSLKSLLRGAEFVDNNSSIYQCLKRSPISKELLDVCRFAVTKDATSGLTTLSVVASTSPFIGLFGTVISILETFNQLGQMSTKSATLNMIAPAIGEALVATAAGIFVATFAYSYHLYLKRKAYEVVSTVEMQSDVLLSKHKKSK